MFLTVPATLSAVDVMDPAAVAALLEAAYKGGLTREDLVRSTRLARGTLERIEKQQRVRAVSVHKLLAALEREDHKEPPTPARRVARTDLSHVDDDALLTELRARLAARRTTDP